ncbi:hypothetical protein MNBD_ALPHA12-971 [hydrothermal vent metagenome]|uniref:DUF985 domain-containing protein n=1 Tax=hydrothermal vent metagenome TaxID=652676 RepID=A0A3B0TBU7_9ZZZZ
MLSTFTRASEVVEYLGLERLPDNAGWFKLICHDVTKQCTDCERPCRHANSTTIFYLFEKDTDNRWYRIDATMIWNFLAGDPLAFSTYCYDNVFKNHVLGKDFAAGQRPLILTPPRDWRILSCLGQWSLASCICTPGFEIEQLEIAPKDWVPDMAGPGPKSPIAPANSSSTILRPATS